MALKGPAEKGMRKSKAADEEFGLTGIALLWRWALGVVIIAVITLVVAFIWKGRHAGLDTLPWIGAAGGLLVGVGIFVSFVGKLTRLHLRFWLDSDFQVGMEAPTIGC